eukprot:1191216-Prorocentrum_minimum.AAC.1
MAPAFVAMLVASGVKPIMAIFAIAYNTNLFGGLSHYASGQSAAYFGKGYVTLPDYFKLVRVIANRPSRPTRLTVVHSDVSPCFGPKQFTC